MNMIAISEAPVQEQHEELFPLLEGEEEPIGDIIQVNTCFRTIKWYERKISQLKEEQSALLQSYANWYTRRIGYCQQRVEVNKQSLHAYMVQKDTKKVSTPEGTAFYRTTLHRNWPDDNSLVAWALRNIPEAIRNRQEPDKKLLAEYITHSGRKPEGYAEDELTKLIIRL